MTTGERIKKRRIELGLSQEELAKRLGNKSRTSVCTVERDKEDLTTDRIRKYAAALECSPSYLIGFEDENGNPTSLAQLGEAYQKKTALERLSKYGSQEIELATHLYELYLQAPPKIQAAVDTLLKAEELDS